MLLNCGVREESWEYLGTARRSNQSILKELSLVLGVLWKDWCWSWNSNTLVTRYEELTHLKRPWCWERLKAGGDGDDTEWDGWTASLTRWTWVWASFGSWWWTGRPGMLQSTGLPTVGHDWSTALNWTYQWSASKKILNKKKRNAQWVKPPSASVFNGPILICWDKRGELLNTVCVCCLCMSVVHSHMSALGSWE